MSIPYGIDVGRPLPPRDMSDSQRRALLFGTWRKDKRLDLAIEAFAELDDWALTIAGPPGDLDRSDLESILRAHGGGSHITIEEKFFDAEGQARVFGDADVVLCLYAQTIEHHSGTLSLAKQWGRPVIVLGPPALTHQVQDEGYGIVLDSFFVD